MLTEIDRRLKQVNNALANQRLEGLEPDPNTVEDLKKVARGEMTYDEAFELIHQRILSGEIYL